MKTLLTVLVVLLPVFTLGWDLDTVQTDTYTGRYVDCTVDSNDELHVVWIDVEDSYPHEQDLWYGHDDDGDGDVEASEIEKLVDGAWECHIALDSNDYPHVAFADAADFDICYMYYDGSNWSAVVDVETTNALGCGGIAVDSSDNIHIVYADRTDSDVCYAYYNGSSWYLEDIDTTRAGSVAITCDGTVPHVAFSLDPGTDETYYADKSGLNWSKTRIATYACGDLSIAVDSNGDNHISGWRYKNFWSDADVMYFTDIGNSWNTVVVDAQTDITSHYGRKCELALDTEDMPHITFCDESSVDVRHAWKIHQIAGWQKEDVETSYECGVYNSIAVDDDDDIYVVYWKKRPDPSYTEWCRFAFKSWTAPNECEAPFVSLTPPSMISSFSVSYLLDYQGGCFFVSKDGEPIEGLVSINIYDLAGRCVDSLSIEPTTGYDLYVPWSTSRVAPGAYLFAVENQNHQTSGSLVVVR